MKLLNNKILSLMPVIILLASVINADAYARWGGGGGGGWNNIVAARVIGNVLVPPDDALWNSATEQSFSLKFINSTGGGGMQGGGDGTGGGTGGTMTVKAIHNGTDIAFLLVWNDATQNDSVNGVDEFSDRVGIMFSAQQKCRMGSPGNPVNIWFWHAARDEVNNIIAGGLGTITKTGDDNIQVISSYVNGQWRVVMSRPLLPINSDNQVDLSNGNSPMAFARWDGSNRERNGKKWITGQTGVTLE